MSNNGYEGPDSRTDRDLRLKIMDMAREAIKDPQYLQTVDPLLRPIVEREIKRLKEPLINKEIVRLMTPKKFLCL